MHTKPIFRAIGYSAVPFFLSILCLSIGRFHISPLDVFSYLFLGVRTDGQITSVLFSLRLPRIILALSLGAGLSVSGLSFQALFSNPLATPDTLAVASGSALGAILSLLAGFGLIRMQLLSLAFGLAAILITYLVSRQDKGSSLVSLILTGIIIGSLANSFISLAKFLANPETQLPQITYYLMGSLSSANWQSLRYGLPPIAIGIVFLYLFRWRLNILSLSEDEARSSGLDINRLRLAVLVSASLITASCVSMAGQVGWIGLLIPHSARMIVGSDNAKLVPLSLSLGASFMLIIDTLARSITGVEIPVSILTSIIGAPFFIYLVRRKGGWGL